MAEYGYTLKVAVVFLLTWTVALIFGKKTLIEISFPNIAAILATSMIISEYVIKEIFAENFIVLGLWVVIIVLGTRIQGITK